MFLGTYEHVIDEKGRLFIPAKLRGGDSTQGVSYILTRGLEECLYLYDAQEFHRKVVEKLDTLPVKNQKEGRAFKRFILSAAQDAPLDDMGRILIPKMMIAHAGLKKEVTILGVGGRIELWSSARWAAYSKKAATTFEKLGEQLDI